MVNTTKNQNKMGELVKTMEVKVKDKKYIIPFPKVRHQLEIQSRRHLLAGGTYGQQERSGSVEAEFNLNLVDALAHITVLCPEILRDLMGTKAGETPDPYDMDLADSKWVVMAYDQFAEWYLEIKEEVNSEMIKARKERDAAKANTTAKS
jgi:hypothetical protein